MAQKKMKFRSVDEGIQKLREMLQTPKIDFNQIQNSFFDFLDQFTKMKPDRTVSNPPVLMNAIYRCMIDRQMNPAGMYELQVHYFDKYHFNRGMTIHKLNNQQLFASWFGFSDLGIGLLSWMDLKGMCNTSRITWSTGVAMEA